MMRSLLAISILVSQCALASESPGDFAYAVPLAGVADDAFYRVAIPTTVHEHAAYADIRDLRVFNANDEVVPHAVRPLEVQKLKREPVDLPFFPIRGPLGSQASDVDISLTTHDGNVSLQIKTNRAKNETTRTLGYLIDLSEQDFPISSLMLDWKTGPDGYIGYVDVEASNDLKKWSALVRDAPLLALSRSGFQLEQKTVSLRGVRNKYLRLSWRDPANGFELLRVNGQPVDGMASLARLGREQSATPGDNAGDYQADLGGQFPIDRMTLILPQDNAIAEVEIYSRNNQRDEWRRVARTLSYRLRQNGNLIESPALEFPHRSDRYWLFKVDQRGGGLGSGSIGLRAEWIEREIVFVARGPAPFRLAFGNIKAHANAFPATTLLPPRDMGDLDALPVATTGALQELAGPDATRPGIDSKKFGLWLALFAGVAVLGVMAWRLSRELGNKSEDNSDPDIR